MGKKLKTMVMKRIGLCDLVVGAATVQGPEVGGALGEYLTPALAEGEPLPELASPITLYGRKLLGYRNDLIKADEVQQAAAARLEEARTDLAGPEERLKGNILSLRSVCLGLWGERKVSSLSLDFNVAQEPRSLTRQAEIIRDRLLSPEVEFVSDRWVKGQMDAGGWADELDGDIRELRPLLRGFIERRKEADTAQVRKQEAMDEFDRQFVLIARLLEATFRVAGETGLADRIRPTVRQLGRDDGQREDSGDAESNSESEGTSEDSPAAGVTPVVETGAVVESSASVSA